jgi:threonine/homoserine/homoserine lactone efflux protein
MLYIIYLGIKQIFITHKEFHISKQKQINTYSPKKIFIKGFMVAATNPKPILFFTAIFPLFLSPGHPVILQFFIMTLTFMAISFISLMTYGFISTHAKAWFFNKKS